MTLKLRYFAVTCAIAFTLSVACEHRAYAYVDPGSGLLLLQSLSALFTGALFFCRKRLKSLITRSTVKETRSEANSE
ncbi:hypothetical protein HDF17_003318 [Granulicella arctica]|uniref:Lipoprotein n=1 Tax=Granulicella arctica TaxID=940613 RepID=A0A7Y9TUL8_9BACT|nr:hypothetical protein [Granulicella arctica]